MERYELQYRTELTRDGEVTGQGGWIPYPHVHQGFPLVLLAQQAEILRKTYVNVRIVKYTTASEVVDE